MDSGRGRRDVPAGLPHSETHGSRAACASPWNIAACRVLRRHPPPRHPSCARKAWPQKPIRGRASGLSMPLRARRAERARHAPSALNLTFKVYFYLSLPVVKERPAASRAAGVEIVSGMVGAPGLEPGTSSLSEKRSNQLSYAPEDIGGAEGTRTHDILLAKQALYQLSYGPLGGPPAPRESSGAIRAEHRPRLRLPARRPL